MKLHSATALNGMAITNKKKEGINERTKKRNEGIDYRRKRKSN